MPPGGQIDGAKGVLPFVPPQPQNTTYPTSPSAGPGFTLAHQQYPYVRYDLNVAFTWDSGQRDMNVAYSTGTSSQQTSVELVTVKQVSGRKIVTFDIARRGIQPQIPSPISTNSNETLLTAEATAANPTLDAAGQYYVYRVTGRYVYSLAQPVFVNNFNWPQDPSDAGQRQSFDPNNTSGNLT